MNGIHVEVLHNGAVVQVTIYQNNKAIADMMVEEVQKRCGDLFPDGSLTDITITMTALVK